ncbi:amidohydrolase [Herbiconiux sp. CPCC 205716]|uniref:Amidohydrolase n=1 Tax=Herbiconiux gentiana TaxID=2970912 RepID=A0ABT2GDJ3_9MICO|nr:amidohydrolase [Herbiconiux gentiana]MCS5714294.1 amidohydrolase [Herbiconiux gentiana]
MGAEVLFENGSVFTAGMERSRAGSVLVRDGVIVAVGDASEVGARADAGAARVDVGGGLVVPGFQDAHVHPVPAGVEMLQCDLSEAGSAAEALRLVGDYAAAHDDEWIVGGGWTMDHFAGGAPTREALDAVTGGRPAVLLSRDHHSAWVNTAALALAGVTASTPDPADGRLERDASGAPSGTLHEGAVGLLDRVRPVPDAALARAGLLTAQEHLLSLGITGWQDALVGEGMGFIDAFPVYRAALESGELRARVTAALWWERSEDESQIERLAARRDEAAALGQPALFVADTVKMMLDGIVENQTASIHGHYGVHPPSSGIDFIDPAALGGYVAALDARGLSVHFHALGDRAVTQALDALQGLDRAGAGRASARRHQLAHLQLVDPADFARFAELGAIANLQAFWARTDEQLRDLNLPILPPGAVSRTYPFGRLARAGAPLAFGSDWPVSTADPLAAIHVAVNRTGFDAAPEPLGGTVDLLDLATALTGYTAGSAFANGRGDTTGQLRPGFLADLAIVDQDLFSLPSDALASARVTATYVGGVPV